MWIKFTCRKRLFSWRLLHTSNIVFKNVPPPCDFWPPLLRHPGDGPLTPVQIFTYSIKFNICYPLFSQRIYYFLQIRVNLFKRTVLQVKECKSPLLLVGKTLGLRCSVEADRVMYSKCGHGEDSGQKPAMRCGQRAQVFCPRNL